MNTPKIKPLVRQHQELKTTYCKPDSNTALLDTIYFWVRQARAECFRLHNTKNTTTKTRIHINLIISFLDTILIRGTHWGRGR